MIDYSIYYRRTISPEKIKLEAPNYDIFVSAYNESDRVRTTFSQIDSLRKVWLIQPEYGYSTIEEPSIGELVRPSSTHESTQISELFSALGDIKAKKVCIDITGFMRHTLVFLVAYLANRGIQSIDFLYSEPISYSKGVGTVFSTTTSGVVRTISGMQAVDKRVGRDHLIIGVGYDAKLIALVSHNKDDSIIHPIFAFPSLSADMYQQSAAKAAQSGEIAHHGDWIDNRSFAPANDPFSTAEVISRLVSEIDQKAPSGGIYLTPLSTKVQTLGFALYWHHEGKARKDVSLLLPELTTYSRETSTGIRRLWIYTAEFI